MTTDLAGASLLKGFLSSKVCFPRLCKLSFYVFKCAACWLWGEWFPESSGFPILGKVIRVTWNVCKTWKFPRPHRGSWLDNVLYCGSIAHSTTGPFFTYFFFFFLRRIVFLKVYWICYNITSVFWLRGTWDLSSQPGINPTSPALRGKVLTTGPLGKSLKSFS